MGLVGKSFCLHALCIHLQIPGHSGEGKLAKDHRHERAAEDHCGRKQRGAYRWSLRG